MTGDNRETVYQDEKVLCYGNIVEVIDLCSVPLTFFRVAVERLAVTGILSRPPLLHGGILRNYHHFYDCCFAWKYSAERDGECHLSDNRT